MLCKRCYEDRDEEVDMALEEAAIHGTDRTIDVWVCPHCDYQEDIEF